MANNSYSRSKKIRQYVGISMIIFATICFIPLFTGLIGFFKHFLLGTFGLFAYPLFVLMFIVGLAMINKKRYVMPVKYLVYISISLLSVLAIIQMAILHSYSGTFFQFLGECYSKQITPGGIVVGIFIAPIKYTLNNIGVYVIFSILLIVFTWLTIDFLLYMKKNAEKGNIIEEIKPKKPKSEFKIAEEKAKKQVKEEKKGDWLVDEEGNLVGKEGETPVVSKIDLAFEKHKKKEEKPKITLDAKIEEEQKENNAKQKLGLIKTGVIQASENIKLNEETTPLQEKLKNKEISRKDYILTPPNFYDVISYTDKMNQNVNSNPEGAFEEEIKTTFEQMKLESQNLQSPEKVFHDENSDFSLFKEREQNSPKNEEISFVDLNEEEFNSDAAKSKAGEIISQIFDDENKTINIKAEEIQPKKEPTQVQINNIETPKPAAKKNHSYVRPPIDLLTTITNNNFDMQSHVQETVLRLEESLTNFNIPAKVVRTVIGPAVTRYELEMPAGISVKKILAHQDDIAYSIASNGNIRIEAPIPGKSAVGIEVPNEKINTIGLKEVINSKEFIEAKAPLTFALGKDINGDIKLCNLAKMPHLLVAGATGSGKSVCLNSVIISLIYKTSPEDLNLILIDPKRVEFSLYDGLPHLLQPRIISDIDKAINALNWATAEMERRFTLFQDAKAKNLEEYNQSEKVLSGEETKLPYIVIIIDELADFMIQAKKELEDKIMRLAAKARACGIHLILATQRPSVNVITGTIKANFPSRIAFAVMSYVDSKTIIDQAGAEKLLGKGDMLYFPNDKPEPSRIQGCFVSTKEVEQVVEFIKANNPAEYDMEIAKTLTAPSKQLVLGETSESSTDELMPLALKYIIENGQASITMIQRKFEVGYPRAARILDQMTELGYVSGADGSKPRSVYITMEQWEELYGDD